MADLWPIHFSFCLKLLVFLPSPCRAYHLLGRRVLAVKVRKSSFFFFREKEKKNPFHSAASVSPFFAIVDTQVIPLDITVELQKQIMSELEILYKVSSLRSQPITPMIVYYIDKI